MCRILVPSRLQVLRVDFVFWVLTHKKMSCLQILIYGVIGQSAQPRKE